MFETPALNNRQELAALLRLAGPLVAANLLNMAVWSIDVIFVARLGQQQLAAASLATTMQALVIFSFSAIPTAVAPLIAAELGSNRHAVREVRRSMRMALWLCAIVGLIGMALVSQGRALMVMTGQEPAIAESAEAFLRISRWAVIPMLIATVMRTFVAALGRPMFATVVSALAVAVNALGNYAFIYGHFGLPAMGIEGSALASVVTCVAMALAYAAMVMGDRRLRRYRIMGRFWRPDWTRLGDIFRIGTPIALTVLAEGGLFSSAAFIMGRLGETELAAHTIALQVAAIAFQVPYGIGQAATIRVGYAYGAANLAAIARSGAVSMWVGLGSAMINSAAMVLIPRLILSAYVDVTAPVNAAMVTLAVQYLLVAAAFQLADAAQAIAAGALRGLQDTRMPMLIALTGYWPIGFTIAIGLGLGTGLRGLGVWIGLAFGLVAVAGLLLWRWRRRATLGLLPA